MPVSGLRPGLLIVKSCGLRPLRNVIFFHNIHPATFKLSILSVFIPSLPGKLKLVPFILWLFFIEHKQHALYQTNLYE